MCPQNQMKHLTTLLTMAITFNGLAQQMPYNPDANGDDFVGVDDVLGVLGVYDTALMQPDLECDYEGTELEQLFAGFLNQSLVLDSLYVEYSFVDSVGSYDPSCPDPIYSEVVLERSFMIPANGGSYFSGGTVVFGYGRSFNLSYDEDSGAFELWYVDDEVASLTSYNNYSFPYPHPAYLPFPSNWYLDENGIQLLWAFYSFPRNCDSFRMIPFWHEAE